MAAAIPNVRKRGDTYSARLGVPPELRAIIGCSELQKPIGTTRAEALRRRHGAIAEFQARLDEARERLKAQAQSNLIEIARGFYERELGRDDDERAGGVDTENEFRAKARDFYAVKLRQLAAGKLGDDEAEALIGWAADEVAANGAAPDAARPDLLKALAGVQLEALARFDQRDRREALSEPKHPLLADQTKPPSPAGAAGQSRIVSERSLKPLSELLPEFHAERRIAPGTADEHRVAVRMVEEFLGGPTRVCEITRSDMLAFKRALTKLPNRYTLRFPGLTLPDAIEANEKRREPFPTLTATTINKKWMAHLKAIFAWCVGNDILPDNPAAGVKVDEGKGHQERTRVAFSPDDLKKIFSAKFAPHGTFGTNQWALLVALFTGARSQREIRRIKLSDIRTVEGVLTFDLEEATKNARSKRIVPVHKRLIDLGLIDYVEALRSRGETLLFPEWNPEDKVNRWFLRSYRKSVGIHDPRKVFHSFRHSLKTALAHAGVNRDVSDLITGHADQSVGGIYIHDKAITMIGAMAEGINRVEFSEIDWKSLPGQK